MSFSAESDHNNNNAHIYRDKDLYCSYNLQHSLLVRERSLATQSHKAATKNLNDKSWSHRSKT